MIDIIIRFYNHPFFIVFGGITATITVFGVVLSFVFWALGIAPLLWRLGLGRWLRRISIVSNLEKYNELRTDLVDSGIFRGNNVSQINPQQLPKIKDSDLILVDYQSFDESQIYEILSYKKNTAGMIFYYPNYSHEKGKNIPEEMRNKISNTPNTTVVNFRGRLLNDIVTTLITTSYEKR